MGGWSGGSALRSLRILRLVRTVRAIRTMLFFRELSHSSFELGLVVWGTMNSLQSLLWLMLILLIIMFIFGVYIVQMVAIHKAEAVAAAVPADHHIGGLSENYGSLSVTVYSLYQAISGGVSWGETAAPLFELSPVLGMLYILYIAFIVFAVLNVVTGVFVDNAQRAAASDIDHVVLEHTEIQQKHISQVVEVFSNADRDGSGDLTIEEFQEHVSNPIVQAYFQCIHLDFDKFGAERLFKLLDFDGGGHIDMNEFVVGCNKLRGTASSLDLAILHHVVKKQGKAHARVLAQLTETLKRLEDSMAEVRAASQQW